MKHITKRLKPGDDLRLEIEKLVIDHNIKAGCVISMVGSLSQAVFRLPEAENTKTITEPLEIVSGTGTLSENGCHIHFSVSSKEGLVFGGHLSKGNIVRTTVELVAMVFDDLEYKRVLDPETDFEELFVDKG